jgi:hypothetical protein
MVGLHLLSDIYQAPGKKPIGSYCIQIKWENMKKAPRYPRRPLDRALNGKQTKQWLSIQGIAGVIIAILLDIIPTVMEMI